MTATISRRSITRTVTGTAVEVARRLEALARKIRREGEDVTAEVALRYGAASEDPPVERWAAIPKVGKR